jgi:hypothetical protein
MCTHQCCLTINDTNRHREEVHSVRVNNIHNYSLSNSLLSSIGPNVLSKVHRSFFILESLAIKNREVSRDIKAILKEGRNGKYRGD